MTVVNVTPATVSGTYRAGQVLTVSDGTWTHDLPNLAYAYSWYRCDAVGANCSQISGAASKTYLLANADVGHTVRARVTATESADPVPPDPGDLIFAEAALSSPITPTISPTTTSFACQSGKDYLIDLGMERRTKTLILTGSPRRVQIRNVWIGIEDSFSASKYSRGGLGIQLIAEHVSVTNYLFEGTPTSTDGIRLACGSDTKVTLQNMLIEAPSDSQEPEEHVDGLQTQGAIGALEIANATIFVAAVRPPNHGGKGTQLDVLSAIGQAGQPYSVTMNRVDYETKGNSGTGARALLAIGKDDNSAIQISLTEVYGAVGSGVSNGPAWENMLINYPSALGKVVTGTTPNRQMTFNNASQGWSGTFKERSPGNHFITRADIGAF